MAELSARQQEQQQTVAVVNVDLPVDEFSQKNQVEQQQQSEQRAINSAAVNKMDNDATKPEFSATDDQVDESNVEQESESLSPKQEEASKMSTRRQTRHGARQSPTDASSLTDLLPSANKTPISKRSNRKFIHNKRTTPAFVKQGSNDDLHIENPVQKSLYQHHLPNQFISNIDFSQVCVSDIIKVGDLKICAPYNFASLGIQSFDDHQYDQYLFHPNWTKYETLDLLQTIQDCGTEKLHDLLMSSKTTCSVVKVRHHHIQDIESRFLQLIISAQIYQLSVKHIGIVNKPYHRQQQPSSNTISDQKQLLSAANGLNASTNNNTTSNWNCNQFTISKHDPCSVNFRDFFKQQTLINKTEETKQLVEYNAKLHNPQSEEYNPWIIKRPLAKKRNNHNKDRNKQQSAADGQVNNQSTRAGARASSRKTQKKQYNYDSDDFEQELDAMFNDDDQSDGEETIYPWRIDKILAHQKRLIQPGEDYIHPNEYLAEQYIVDSTIHAQDDQFANNKHKKKFGQKSKLFKDNSNSTHETNNSLDRTEVRGWFPGSSGDSLNTSNKIIEPGWVLENEFLIKIENRSYMHLEWHNLESLKIKFGPLAGDRLRRFNSKKRMIENENLTKYNGAPFDPQYIQVDRIIASCFVTLPTRPNKKILLQFSPNNQFTHHPTSVKPQAPNRVEMFLVKWCGLGYSSTTWETFEDIGDEFKIAQYRRFNHYFDWDDQLPNYDAQEFLKRRDSWYQKSPIYKNGNQLRDYQVYGLNWLIKGWHENRLGILAGKKKFETAKHCRANYRSSIK